MSEKRSNKLDSNPILASGYLERWAGVTPGKGGDVGRNASS
jgi:hypothetical protein